MALLVLSGAFQASSSVDLKLAWSSRFQFGIICCSNYDRPQAHNHCNAASVYLDRVLKSEINRDAMKKRQPRGILAS
jgi:hypothetical protein